MRCVQVGHEVFVLPPNDLNQKANLLQWITKAEIYMSAYCFLRAQACDFVCLCTDISTHKLLFKCFSKTK